MKPRLPRAPPDAEKNRDPHSFPRQLYPLLPVNRFQADDIVRDRHLTAKVKGVSFSNACHLIFFIRIGLFSVRMLSLLSLLIFESNCFAIFTVFQLFYLLFTFFSLSCFAFLFVCFYF